MGQRISIQYTIDIDDLEAEVDRLLKSVGQKLKNLSGCHLNSELSLKTLENIDEIRLALASADATLQDVSAIVNGYISYKASDAMMSSQPEEEVDNNPTQKPGQKYEESTDTEYSF